MSTKKILIVDDDLTTAKVMQLYIENFGYATAGIAMDGDLALSLTEQERPDLVLMDIILGKGLDGISAAEIIQKHFGIPVVFVTSHAEPDTLERAKAVSPAGYVNKPLRDTDLKTTIELALARSPAATGKTPASTGTSITDILISLYGLTKSEAKLVAKLIEYPDLNTAAESLHVSPLTVKTHLKRIYRKTDTNRMPVLIHKIVTGPAGMLIKNNSQA